MKLIKLSLLLLSFFLIVSCEESDDVQLGTIIGTVTDGVFLEPLQGVSVSLSPTGKTMSTGSDGKFEFPNVEAGQYTISVSKESYNSDSKSVYVDGGTTTADFIITTGNGAIELSKTTLDFGTSDNTLVFDIENIGKSDMTYTIECSAYDWMSVSPKSGTISSSRIEPITVTIDRDKIDKDMSVTLPISSNAGSAEVLVKVTHEVATAVMSLSKSTLDFGETNTTLSFDVTNSGNADLDYTIPSLGDWITFSPSSKSLSAGSTTTVIATIDRSLISSSINQTMTVSSNVGSQEITVIVTKPVEVGVLSVSTSSLDFGENYSQLTFTIKNSGNADLNYTIPSLGDWIVFSPSSNTLAAGSTSTITATIDRTKITSSLSQTLTITSDVGSHNIEISVTKAIEIGVLNVSTTSLDFGETLDVLTFTISNTGTADFDFGIWLVKPDWLSFTCNSTTVNAGESQVVTVKLDRTLLYGDGEVTCEVRTDVGSEYITISAYEPISYGTSSSPYSGLSVEVTSSYVSGNYYYLEYKATWSGSEDCYLCVGYNNTVGYDDEGNSYSPNFQGVSLGSYDDWSSNPYLTDISTGTVIKGSIRLSYVDANATKFTSIKLSASHKTASDRYYNSDYITFYDVPIMR
ncbi:MAG: carboxypeptidase regulatory-like domain-containing protein [Rikenellaceae bacterium]